MSCDSLDNHVSDDAVSEQLCKPPEEHPAEQMPAPPTPHLPRHFLHLFSGPHRRSDLGSCIKELCGEHGVEATIDEYDTGRSRDHDLLDDPLWG